jgi:predicted membrane-bound mannosyltransferase
MLVALSPQLAYNSLLLLPDSLAVLPILLAIYFIVRARKQSLVIYIIAAGGLIGLSCWLRANALLLAPFLSVLVFFVLSPRSDFVLQRFS